MERLLADYFVKSPRNGSKNRLKCVYFMKRINVF